MSDTSFNNRRKSSRTELNTRVPASCLFNRWFKPVIDVEIVDISNHGMKIFTRDYLKLSSSTIRVNELGQTIRGKFVWRNERDDGFMYGFMVAEGDEISNDDIQLLTQV